MALTAQLATHALGQGAGDRQPQPGAAIAAEIELSACWNATNIISRRSLSIPMPVSRTLQVSQINCRSTTCQRASTCTWPRSVNFSALPTRFSRIWRMRVVAVHLQLADVGRQLQVQPRVAGRCAGRTGRCW